VFSGRYSNPFEGTPSSLIDSPQSFASSSPLSPYDHAIAREFARNPRSLHTCDSTCPRDINQAGTFFLQLRLNNEGPQSSVSFHPCSTILFFLNHRVRSSPLPDVDHLYFLPADPLRSYFLIHFDGACVLYVTPTCLRPLSHASGFFTSEIFGPPLRQYMSIGL